MRLLPSQDERDLASMLNALFLAECPTSLVRQLRDSDRRQMPDRLWKALADAGVFGLFLPEEYGGAAGTLSDLGVFCVEAGRALCPTVVHTTLQAALAILLLGGPDQHAAWLPSLSAGTLCATTGLWSAHDAAVIAPTVRAYAGAGRSWRLSGTVDFVADADLADHIVVSAASDTTAAADRTLGFVVALSADGVHIEAQPLMGGHRAFRILLDAVEVMDRRAVLAGPHGEGVHDQDLRRVANSAVFWIGQGRTGTRETAIARMHAASAAKSITLDAHQLHGGMGYVVETDLHLFSERARVLSTLGAARMWQRRGWRRDLERAESDRRRVGVASGHRRRNRDRRSQPPRLATLGRGGR